ncbi:glycosyltransferase family 39 protein [Halomonas cerina]|nr:glycosyltransferase family 39 protein [Halomonas cerina]
MAKGYARAVVYLLILSSVMLAATGVVYGYSYWWDELYSVAAAELGVGPMFRFLVLPDVHPPLYQLVLNLWIKVAGSGEQMVRALSFLFAISALAAFWWWASKRLTPVAKYTLLVFFATCILFPYYAQEARSYAMMLLLSTLASLAYLERLAHSGRAGTRLGYYALLGALSLTHYFGFIYAGVILLFTLYENRGDARRAIETVVVGLMCLIWPILHVVYGGIGEKSGDNFWIESNGVQSTLFHFSDGMLPHLNYLARLLSGTATEYVTAVLIVALLSGAALLARRAPEVREAGTGPGLWRRMIALLTGFLVVIALVDYHSPISTPRNFIVLLPVVSLLVGLTASGLKRAGVKHVVALVALGGIANLAVASLEVTRKIHPDQNHKAAVAFIEEQRDAGDPVYYLDRGGSMREVQHLVASFYFNEEVPLAPIAIGQVATLAPPYYVLMQHHGHNLDRVLADIARRGIAVEAFVPQNNESVAVVYVEGRDTHRPRHRAPMAAPAARMLVRRSSAPGP